ncbi:MAG: MATE family efflux transporter [Bacteroidales bacterium]|nr:MATE family efflux transporter [Bacteroidales bacterium]
MTSSDISINRQILRLAIPSILANITVPIVGIVDLAIAGHIGDATTMGGIAIGTMLFDLLYWNMGFLRVGTGGITAQAYGRGDFHKAVETFCQGIITAWGVAAIILALQTLFIFVAFLLVDCTPEVEILAKEYFFIRIWAVPATLSLMVFRGWFIGMQNTVFPMILDITVNVINAAASYFFAVSMKMGIAGVAYGTILAQYIGFTLAIILIVSRYKALFKGLVVRACVRWNEIRSFFKINSDLFLRSLMMLVVYTGFTSISATYGDTELAVGALMMKMLLLYSYFVDGFAYAGEALSGRFIGARDSSHLKETVGKLFVWCFAIGIVSTFAYAFFGRPMVHIFSSDAEVIAGCEPYLFWLLLMPVISCIAFTWDGIYIGATASAALRNSMVWSASSFVITYIALKGLLGIQALYLAYFIHLFVRSLYLTLVCRKNVFVVR